MKAATGRGGNEATQWLGCHAAVQRNSNVPTHTPEIAIIDVRHFEGDFTFEVYHQLFQQRLHLLEPSRYKLVETRGTAARMNAICMRPPSTDKA